MLEHAVHDAADAKGGLDDGGREVASALLLRDLADGHHRRCQRHLLARGQLQRGGLAAVERGLVGEGGRD